MTSIRKTLTIAFALALVAAALAPAQDDERPPNVLLIVADDQGWADLGCMGIKDDVRTPHLDALAARGVRFTQAYATSPICNASRAGLITGCYQQRFGTFWYGGKGIHDASFPTLPELLRGAVYETAYVGKFHYGGGAAARPGNRSFPLEHGFESFYGFHGGRKHYLRHTAADEARFQASRKKHGRKGQSLRQGPMFRGEKLVDQQGFSTELFGREARTFLERKHERPFFLQLAFSAVHNFTHQLPAGYLEKHGLQGYRDWDPSREEYYDWYRAGRRPNNPEGRAHYLGQLHFLDREVGRVLDTLEKTGLAENTLIVYIGDNGGSTPIYADNGPLRGSKYTLYEGGIRIPLIVAFPKRYPGSRVCDLVVSSMDLLPTICRLAGVEPPKRLDGHDIHLTLRGGKKAVYHRTLVWDTHHETAVRHENWKLKTAKRNRHARYEMVEVELGTFLYDLAKDPGEKECMAKEHPEVVEKLLAIHRTWRAKIGE